MNRTIALGCALLLFGVVGCKKKNNANAPATSAQAATSAAPADSVAASQIPTEEDYEEQAAQQVTPHNLDSQLDKLEKEIGQ